MMNRLINKNSLADEVAAELQKLIALGRYRVNEKLPIEPELMKMFGVGRSTIREAIKILTNSGMLRVQQGLGTFVENAESIKEPLNQRLKRADINDLDEIRQLLEMKIAEKAAVNREQEDLDNMQKWLTIRKETADGNQLEACIDADIQFHTAIAVASKSAILADLYKAFSVHVKRSFMTVYQDTSVFKSSQQIHEQLFKNIELNDSKQAWLVVAKIIGHISQ